MAGLSGGVPNLGHEGLCRGGQGFNREPRTMGEPCVALRRDAKGGAAMIWDLHPKDAQIIRLLTQPDLQ